MAKKLKVSAFVHDLSSNPIVRAYPILKAIQNLGYEVEVLGLTYNSDDVYPPYKDEFEYKTIRSYLDIRWVIKNGFKLSKMASGDIVYSFKPVWGSFWAALLYSRFGLKRRLLLDAEDNELYDAFIGNGWRYFIKSPWYPINPIYNKLIHPFTWLTSKKTVVCKSLQKRYGGQIILHGPRETPVAEVPPKLESSLQIPGIKPKDFVILFAGKPVKYNGVTNIVEAIRLLPELPIKLLLVGNPDEPIFKEAKNNLGKQCILTGYIPHEELKSLFPRVNLAPIIQQDTPSTQMQIPAKLLEAMTFGIPVLVTDVCDLKDIVGEGRGDVIPSSTPSLIAEKIASIFFQPKEETQKKTQKARDYAIQEISVSAIEKKLKPIFDSLTKQ